MIDFADFSRDELRRYQLKLTEMLEYFDEFCNKYGITYYLAFGSCLGAIRHKGFIPWDDDLDISMPRKDYERLWKLWNENTVHSNYNLSRTTSDSCIKFQIMLLRDANTTCIFEHSKDLDLCHGIKIDISPLDESATNPFSFKLQTIYAKLFELFAAQRVPNHGSKFIKVMARFLLGVVRSTKIRTAIWQFCERQFVKYNDMGGSKVRAFHSPACEKSIFGTPKRVKFENITVNIPEKYDEYLTMCYGDYMKEPPIEEQKPEMAVHFYDINKSFKEYKGLEYLVNKSTRY